MNNIIFNNICMPILNGCDLCAASEPFYHADRTIDFNVLIYVIEGTIYVTENDIDYAVNAGEMLFLKNGLRHFGKREIPKGTRWYFVHFYFSEQPALEEFTPSSTPIQQYEPVKFSRTLPKFMSDLNGSRIEKKLAELVEYFHSDDNMKKWNINLRLHDLLTEIAMYNAVDERPRKLSDRIADYINSHYTEPFSARILEKEFFLSYKYMAAVFKKETGRTMQQYHTFLRMTEACRLLKSTLMSIGEISERVGYQDMLYFSRCFHSTYGMSPIEYRRNVPKY